MNNTDDAVALVKERADILQIIGETVELRRSGTRHVGLCPFHGEKTPSFSVSAGEGFFHCFGCQESGDVLSYVMKYYALSFPEALKMLAERYGIELPEKKRSAQEKAMSSRKKALFAVNERVTNLYADYLHKNSGGKTAREYLQRRGVSSELAHDYRLGYAPSTEVESWHFLGDHLSDGELELAEELGLVATKQKGGFYDRFRDRILFPIMDLSGQVCGFGGRIIGEGQPKYMNSPDSVIFNKSNLLLGLYQQKDAIRKNNSAILVEGNFDLISLVAGGVKNVVAPLGTALTREQVRLIKRFAESGVLLFDGDGAGIKAAVRSVPIFLAEHMAGKVVLLPEGEDPDSYIHSKGKKGVISLLNEAKPLPEFAFETLVTEHGLSIDGKSRIIEGLKPLVQAAASPLQRSVIMSHFAGELGLDIALLEKNLKGSVQDEQGGRLMSQPEPPPPSPPFHEPPSHPVVPLSPVQKRFVEFMVLHPMFFARMEEAGVRELLEGSTGEIIYLQLSSYLKEHGALEPEEFLALLPRGGERKLVADMLLGAERIMGDSSPDEEFADLQLYMRQALLQKRSKNILDQIQRLPKTDYARLPELLQEKMEIDRIIKKSGGSTV